ncbi:MAG: DUF502 domain-containing protein [Thermodesulfovibrionia bacterium]|nr:DUF502 domain-containing protein [Thermodesulfovibrionia bacterium]MCK5512788.1 DUF502 domain-containing protein [Thermodesulfovibrionia bacterium]
MKKLTRYFFEGLLFLVPVVATIYVVYIIFMKIDSLFKFTFPGLGFLVTILTIIVVGFVASNFLTSRIVRLVDSIFSRLPLIKMIYTSIKDLINAFVGDKKGFNKPVLVTLSQEMNIQVVGFLTRESLEHLGLSDRVAVYLPQSYNFAGNLVVVPREQVTPLNVESGDIMAFILSGGITVK